ncbi:hypothetical protein [Fimbriiglobus ruber]|uniref:DUF1795 domain-containing protein n=1 Tax=Fimbriiglobus ruber TaxID=1908690 RepID=A0A225D825_9BACT|nr:hypothetical protein [Fimbriiglobus ruber]OWK34698.1 hypothetical protein FRUB_09540 [Fimbriiglobus ruber]
MIKTFTRSGVRFQYPTNWTMDLDEADGAWTATFQSPETAFLLVSLRPDAETTVQVAEEALAALKVEYAELEAETAIDNLAGQPAVGHDIDFFTLDTAVVCWTRCIDTLGGPLLVMCQVSEFDRARQEPVLRAVCASLKIDED